MTAADIMLGVRVLYRGRFGLDAPIPGVVDGVGEEAGRRVYDVLLDDGRRLWGYGIQLELEGQDDE